MHLRHFCMFLIFNSLLLSKNLEMIHKLDLTKQAYKNNKHTHTHTHTHTQQKQQTRKQLRKDKCQRTDK